MSLEMPQGLRWLSYLAGTAWPEGDEDALFALAQDWDTAVTDLRNLVAAVEAACDAALDNYAGSGRDQMASQFKALLSGDQSVDAIVKNVQQIGDSVHDCGTQIEYTKLQIISTLAIMAAEIAWALATLWGAFAVPAIEAEGAGIMQIIGRALTNRLIAHAARVARMPLWKLTAIEVAEQGAIGFVQDLAIQAYQKDKGHRSGIDWKQTLTTAAVAGISGGVATPVGHYIGAGLGNWLGRDSMTWWKSSGVAVASAVPAGLAGAGAGIVANGVITGDWEFDPAALLGGVGGGLVGGVHGVIGHVTQTRLSSLSLAGGFADGSAPMGDDSARGVWDLPDSFGAGAVDEKASQTAVSASRTSTDEKGAQPPSPARGRSVDDTLSRSRLSASRTGGEGARRQPSSFISANGGDGSSVRTSSVAASQRRPQPVASSRDTGSSMASVVKSAPAARASDSAANSAASSRPVAEKSDGDQRSFAESHAFAASLGDSRRAELVRAGSEPGGEEFGAAPVVRHSVGLSPTTEHVAEHDFPLDPDHRLRSSDDAANLNACGPLALAKVVELTGSTVARVPESRVGGSGMSALELEAAAGAPLHRFDDHDSVGDHLLDLGPGSIALVVDTYHGPTDRRGVGAHAYLLRNVDGEVRVIDAAGQRPRASSDVRSTHAILYTASGIPHLLPEQRTSHAERFGMVRIGMHNPDDDVTEPRSEGSRTERDSTAERLDGEGKPEPSGAEPNRRPLDRLSDSGRESELRSGAALREADEMKPVKAREDSKSELEELEPEKVLEPEKEAEPRTKVEPELPWDIPKIMITPAGDDLPVAVREFGSRRDGAKDLTNIIPIPETTMKWLHEQIFHIVEGNRGVDENFRSSVRRVLSQRLLSSDASVWPQLMSATGMPLRVKYKGRRYPISLRVSLRPLGPSKEQIAPLADGPPVGIQQWAFGILSTADTASNGDYRNFSYAYAHTFPADHGALTYISLGGELDLVNNQVSTSVTVTSTVQPMVIIRSKGRSWPFDFEMTWELSHGDSLGDALSPAPTERVWHATVGDPSKGLAAGPPDKMLVWFPDYLKVGKIPTINHNIPSTVPAPMRQAVGEFHLYGPVTIPDHANIMSDVMSSFREDLKSMSDNSMSEFREFFGEGNFRSLITAAARTTDDLPATDDGTVSTGEEKETDESSVISPTLYTRSGKTIGALQVSVELHGGEEITGPTTEKSVLESFVLRSLGMQGSSVTSNSLGINPSLGFGFGGKEKDSDTGIQSLGGQITIKGGVSQKFSHTLSYGGSARIAHSLRTGEPLLHVTPRMTVHVTLIRPNSHAVDPAPGTPLASGHDYPVNILVPSVETLGHAPTTPLYLPSEILHLRQLGVSTTPLAVHGTKPLFAEVRRWMSGLGFFPPDRDVPNWQHGTLTWLSDKTTLESTHTERLNNVRKFEQMSNQLGLRGGLDEAIEGEERIGKDGKPMWDGGAPTWFELPTSTGTRRISVFLITERLYLSDDAHEGVTHEWTLPKVQTLNYSGSTIPGDEQFSKTPWAWNIGGNGSISTPFDEKARHWFQGFTPDYTFSGGKSEIRDSNSGTGHEYYTLSPTENGTQIFGVPVRHRIVMTYSHGDALEDLTGKGGVRLAVPTYRTHAEKFDDRPLAPTFRDVDDDDIRRLALPSAGRSLEDNVFRPPDTTIFDRVGGSREVRRAAFDLIDDIALQIEQETAEHGTTELSVHTEPEREPETDAGDLSAEDTGGFRRIIGAFPSDPEEFEMSFWNSNPRRTFTYDFEDDAAVPDLGGSVGSHEFPQILVTPTESRDGHDGSFVDVPLDDVHEESPQHEIIGAEAVRDDDLSGLSVPGAFPREGNTADEASESTLTWPQVRDFLQDSTHWAVGHAGDMGYRVARWLWRNAVGEPATNPASMAHEAIHTALSPYHMTAGGARIFRDSYPAVEGASTPGALAGTNITVKTTGYLTNIRVRPRPPKMDAERWLQSVSGTGHTDSRQSGHQWGASLTESVGKVDRNVIPGTAYHYSTSNSHSDTVNDNSAVFRVTTEDTTPVHWFIADAHYLVKVRAGVRNLAYALVHGTSRIDRSRVVDMPDAVEFMLLDNDLQNNPDLLALVNDANLEAGLGHEYGEIAEANPPDRGLPLAYVKGKRIGYGAVTNVEVEGGREAYQNIALGLVEEYAPGITDPGSANYLAGVETRINEHTTTLALRTLPNAGPDGRTAFHLIDRTRPFDPQLVELTFSARPDPSVDLGAIRGKRVTGTSGLDNIFGHSNGDGAALDVPGATRMSDSRKRGHQIDFTLSGQHGGHRPKLDVAVQRQSNVTEIQTSSRERRAWQRSFGNTSEFPVPHEYVVEIRKRPLDEARLALLVRRGISGFAMAGGGIGLLPPLHLSDLAELAAPTTESRSSLKASTLVRFNTSETPEADSLAEFPAPSLYRSDPSIRPPDSAEGDAVIEMEISPAVQKLLEGPTWVPTRGIEIYEFEGVPELATALRQVDPSLDIDDRMLTNRSSEGMFIRLTTLVESNRLTMLGPAATAPFLNTRAQREPDVPGPPARDDGQAGPTSVKITLYSPKIEKTSKDIAIDDIWWSGDGFTTEADNSINTTANFGLSSPYGGEANDRGAWTIPLTGEHAGAGQFSSVTSNRRELLRFGTPMEGAAPKEGGETVGTVGHRLRALAMIEVRGPEGTLWVSGDALIRTTETPPGLEDLHSKPPVEEGDFREVHDKTPSGKKDDATESEGSETIRRKSGTGTDAEAKSKSTTEPEPKSESESDEPKPDAEVEPEAKPKVESDANAEGRSKSDAAAKAEAVKSEAEAKRKAAEAKSGAKGKGLEVNGGEHSSAPAVNGVRRRGLRSGTVGQIPAPAGHLWESMPMDGDCFFYALERVVYHDDPPATAAELDRRIRGLRAEVARELRADPDTYFRDFHAILAAARVPGAGDLDRGELRNLLRARNTAQLRKRFDEQIRAITNRRVWRNAVSHLVPQAATAVLARRGLTLRVQNEELRATGGWTLGADTTATPDATTLVHGSHYYLAVPTGDHVFGSTPRASADTRQPAHPPVRNWDEVTDLLGPAVRQHTPSSYREMTSRTPEIVVLGDSSGARYIWLPPSEAWPGEMHDAADQPVSVTLEQALTDPTVTVVRTPGPAGEPAAAHDPNPSPSDRSSVIGSGESTVPDDPRQPSVGEGNHEFDIPFRMGFESRMGSSAISREPMVDRPSVLRRRRGGRGWEDMFPSPLTRQRSFPLLRDETASLDPRLFTAVGDLPDLIKVPAEPEGHETAGPTLPAPEESLVPNEIFGVGTGETSTLRGTLPHTNSGALDNDGRSQGADGSPLIAETRPLRNDGRQLDPYRPVRADSGSPTAGRRLRTDGTARHADEVRTDDAPRTDGSPEPAARSRTPLQRLRRVVSRLHGRFASGTDGVESRPAARAPRRHLRDIFGRTFTRFRSRTTSSSAGHGDGAAPHAAITNSAAASARKLRKTSDSVADVLTGIRRDTGSSAIRVTGNSSPLPGRSRRDLERAAGGRLRGYPDDHRISRQLQLLGPGAQALVVAVHSTVDANGIGAHAYRMFDHHGTILVHDTTDHTHMLPGQRTPTSVHAILYTSDGTISHPLRLRDETIPGFPRNIRIGARPDPRTVI